MWKRPFSSSLWAIQLIEITDLIQSKRALAWAGMAQRLAHEIKTPLSSVMLAAQQLQIMCEKKHFTEKSVEYLTYIIDQVYRLRAMTDAFMKFARLTKPNLQQGNVNVLLNQCLADFGKLIPSSIQIKKELDSQLPPAIIDTEEITIALKNIIENSLKAMQGKGILTITTRLEQLLHLNKQNIVIEINDTGCGISSSHLN